MNDCIKCMNRMVEISFESKMCLEKRAAKEILQQVKNELNYYKYLSVTEGDLSFEEIEKRFQYWIKNLKQRYEIEET